LVEDVDRDAEKMAVENRDVQELGSQDRVDDDEDEKTRERPRDG
jgi:hypothetical protein